ncbi:DUF928 domain-containing protein [Leptothoe spongobia]|uniref:DUF928 domain-containing protein n=1 Tax=Leptothoe spongobia TAU-MAC 1115 TaxID=1967444 RepID=A0A947DBV8_9CYAN|nr:DUF928 domain-containing protein [Leptothoe spongobia]MBT9314311.1 DUF928 domain-containing protein [Leptothoe spongobia TAU-MAC 1115]
MQQLMTGLKSAYLLSSAILAGCITLSLITPGFAGERIRWTPDAERGSIGSTLSGGRRGQEAVSCNASEDTARLSLIVPGDRSRLLTTVTNPTLTWHVATVVPVSMTFHFSDPTLANPIYTQNLEIAKTSTISITLPKETLTTGKKYRWTVLLSCPDEPQTEISARSFVERVDRESLDINNLSSLEQASVYANQGIWYDAIAALLEARSQGVTNAETMVQTLLEQGQSQAEVNLSTVVHL